MPNNTNSQYPTTHLNAISGILFILVLLVGGIIGFAMYVVSQPLGIVLWIVTILLAWLVSSAVKIASQWEKAVVLRLGTFASMRGPGLFFIIPFVDTIPYWLDLRTITSAFRAEQTLTRDNVPVDVDAILFWRVVDPKKAALEVADYNYAVNQASQTALRDVIGKTELSTMLTGREAIDAGLQEIIDSRVEPWGIKVISVEIRDVIIPSALQSAMSQQAQAERERQARVILGDSERQIAEKFEEAAKHYENNPTALHLRAMNMLYEGLKEKGALIIVPSSAVESMNLGGIAGYAALNNQYNNPERGQSQSRRTNAD
jgi:regulator of protease activity HflC (stomatin/prohibitin superfamily)